MPLGRSLARLASIALPTAASIGAAARRDGRQCHVRAITDPEHLAQNRCGLGYQCRMITPTRPHTAPGFNRIYLHNVAREHQGRFIEACAEHTSLR